MAKPCFITECGRGYKNARCVVHREPGCLCNIGSYCRETFSAQERVSKTSQRPSVYVAQDLKLVVGSNASVAYSIAAASTAC